MQDTSVQHSALFRFCCVCTTLHLVSNAPRRPAGGSCLQNFRSLTHFILSLSASVGVHRERHWWRVRIGENNGSNTEGGVCWCVCVCIRVTEREREKNNKMEKRLTMLSGLPQCFPAACQLNHQDTGDTSESYPWNKTAPPPPPLLSQPPPSVLNSVSPSAPPDSLHKNSKNNRAAVHRICTVP